MKVYAQKRDLDILAVIGFMGHTRFPNPSRVFNAPEFYAFKLCLFNKLTLLLWLLFAKFSSKCDQQFMQQSWLQILAMASNPL